MKKVLIVEDEILIADGMERNLTRLGYTVTGIAPDYEKALELIQSCKPDVILLDIRLEGEKTGIDLAHIINREFHIPFVFVTSHLDPATLQRAKSTHPAGYLTKPYTPETLFTTLEIAMHNSSLVTMKEDVEISLKDGKTIHRIKASEILYIETDHVYITVYTPGKKLMIRSNLKKVLEDLTYSQFMRVHRSFAVNLQHVQSVSATFIWVNNVKLPLSKSYREDLIRLLENKKPG